VGDEDAPSGELEEGRQDGGDAWCPAKHVIGDAREQTDVRRQGCARIDKGLELAENLAGADLDRADLGDAAIGGRGTGGFEVDDDEGDVAERGAQLLQGALHERRRPRRRRIGQKGGGTHIGGL
jgi:hypothetical protein